MNWDLAIEKNHAALQQIVAGLFMLVRWVPVLEKPTTLTRETNLHLGRILRKAEAALRRLIVLVMKVRAINVIPHKRQEWSQPGFAAKENPTSQNPPQFNLIDPRKPLLFMVEDDTDLHLPENHAGGIMFEETNGPQMAAASGMTNAGNLIKRLEAIDHALNTLPDQAKRLVRLLKRRENAPPGPGRTGPIRPGKPPGYCFRPLHEADHVLQECHGLLCDYRASPP